jgi:hypothetical protein
MVAVIPEAVNLRKRKPRWYPERGIWGGDSAGGGIPAGAFRRRHSGWGTPAGAFRLEHSGWSIPDRAFRRRRSPASAGLKRPLCGGSIAPLAGVGAVVEIASCAHPTRVPAFCPPEVTTQVASRGGMPPEWS